MRKALIFAVALTVTGCAAARDLTLAAGALVVATDPNRHVSTVIIDGERRTVTTTVSRDGRRSTVRVSP